MKIVRDLSGKKFGRLSVIKLHEIKKWGAFWVCECSCGKVLSVYRGHLVNNHTRSCGCLKQKLPKGEAAFRKLLDQYKRNAKKRNIQFKLSTKQFKSLVTANCFYCDTTPSSKSHGKRFNGIFLYSGIDRVDSSLAYSKGNCVPCCGKCNTIKMDMSQEEFLEQVSKIYETHSQGKRT